MPYTIPWVEHIVIAATVVKPLRTGSEMKLTMNPEKVKTNMKKLTSRLKPMIQLVTHRK